MPATSPGAPAAAQGNEAARKHLTLLPPRTNHAPGAGSNARTLFIISFAGEFQSIRSSSFWIGGA